MWRRLVAGLLACASCAAPEPPAPRAPAPPTSPAPPLPSSAFVGPEGDAPRAPAEDRFAPRTIGPRSEDVARGPRWSGAKVDLDVKGADVHDVLRLIADVGRVNLVVADDVRGTITLRLRGVPWDQALDVVARAKGLAVERDGAVLMVGAAAR